MELDIKLEGWEEFADKLKKSPVLFDKVAKNSLEVASDVVWAEARVKAPIWRGRLRGSIFKKVEKVKNGEWVGRIGSRLEYAPYQEYGTGLYGPFRRWIVPKRAKFLVFRSRSGKLVFAKRVRGSKPKRFMQKGLLKLKRKMDVFNKMVIDFIKELVE